MKKIFIAVPTMCQLCANYVPTVVPTDPFTNPLQIQHLQSAVSIYELVRL